MGWTLVTGGAKRLGAEICRTLAQRRYNILVHYRSSEQEALDLVQECREYGVKTECIYGDFTTHETTAKFLESLRSNFPNIENLINNVGNYLQAPPTETSPEQWNSLFQTNVNAPFACIHALLPSITAAKGNIINLGVSGIQTVRANTATTAYCASKLSLLMLTKSLARELAPKQVRVNMVSPGYMDISVDRPENPASIPMQRVAITNEVTRVIAFLLDKESAYITGQNIEVSGGLGL